ncbi:MAG: hypothetical protein N2578_04230 [Bdellovibrionaceae bacterium]|nr:hypothetical protein [Pseudobdellovibrionaceae bacterium]
MSSANHLFYTFCLCVVGVLAVFFSIFERHLNSNVDEQIEIVRLKAESESLKLANQALTFQLEDFRQQVATILPTALPRDEQHRYDLRMLDSVVRLPASASGIDLSSILFNEGRSLFAKKEYAKSEEVLLEMLDKYPLSRHTVEANFLIFEGRFLRQQYSLMAEIVEKMVEQWPENEITGLAILRMAEVSELNAQPEVAMELYQAVEKAFQANPQLVKSAKQKMANLRRNL